MEAIYPRPVTILSQLGFPMRPWTEGPIATMPEDIVLGLEDPVDITGVGGTDVCGHVHDILDVQSSNYTPVPLPIRYYISPITYLKYYPPTETAPTIRPALLARTSKSAIASRDAPSPA